MIGVNMKHSLLIIASLAIFTFSPHQAHADAVDNAYRVCEVFKNTGMSSDCKVKGGRSIHVSMDTTGVEANKICRGVVSQLAGAMSFDSKWTLRIFSPFSGDNQLASCTLK